MKSKAILTIACCFLGLAVTVGAQQQQRNFPQPAAAREVTITEIPGVIAAGAKWKLVWQGTDNADGLVGAEDGGVLFAQEQPSRVGKVDKNDKFSIYAEDTHGTGGLAIDSKGRLLGVERTCTDPGGKPDQCKEPTALIVIKPARQILSDRFEGKEYGRMGDLVADKKGGAYFKTATGTYFYNSSGKVSQIAGSELNVNGIMLSTDEKTLFVTNGPTVVVFDVQPDGSVRNKRDFAKLEAGGSGDGMAIDAADRLYVTSAPGVQVFSKEGKYLGLIPLPRTASSVAFSGPDKKTLYAKGAGALGPDGKEFRTPPGVRNNAKAIYKVEMSAQGYKGRVK